MAKTDNTRVTCSVPVDPYLSEIEAVWMKADGVTKEQVIAVWKGIVQERAMFARGNKEAD